MLAGGNLLIADGAVRLFRRKVGDVGLAGNLQLGCRIYRAIVKKLNNWNRACHTDTLAKGDSDNE